ncbi:hypothetical protein [Terriglobus roseus]|nr:hypothetical protein [Terriglobus roseus]
MHEQLDDILKSAARPEYVFGADALLETIYVIKELALPESHLLPIVPPDFFSGELELMDFNYWASYLGMQSDS